MERISLLNSEEPNLEDLDSYNDLVKSVYIKPIRSVLIIDDDYPTWEEIFHEEDVTDGSKVKTRLFSAKGWKKDSKVKFKAKNVINSLRASDNKLILDISDGTEFTPQANFERISNLHQTDLLILDYQLDKTSEDGTKAIRIAREINKNAQFNLVIVQTSAELDKAYRDILLGLLTPCPEEHISNIAKTGFKLVDDCGDPDIVNKIRKSITAEQYFGVRHSPETALKFCHKNKQPFSGFKAVCVEQGWSRGDIKSVLGWAISDFEKNNKDKMHNEIIPNLSWSSDSIKWIRSSTAFMAFTKKVEVVDLIDRLQTTLTVWAPRPSRLLLAKIRNELEKRGSIAEDIALGNNHVLAKWYQTLIDSDEDNQTYLLRETLNRHYEQLLESVSEEIIRFGHKIIRVDNKQRRDTVSIIKDYFNVNLENEGENTRAELDHNIFICSTKPSGEHLRTGHIFKLEGAYWVCLSPLCDLVPGQKDSGVYVEVGNRMPFVGLKLREIEGANSGRKFNSIKEDVQSNRYVFFEHNGDKKVMCFNAPGKKEENSLPHWYPLYANNKGKFSTDLSLKVYKVKNGTKGRLVFKMHDTQIISQLRYEYALNLMNKLTGNMNRIGLNFSS